jgi:putative peptide zinc metalloprotease protein
MKESLFNQAWYRIADLRVKLRQHAEIHRHIYRGKPTYILQDHVTGQFHRFTPEVYQLIALMDGKRTLENIWEIACEKLGDHMPTQNDIINLVAKLHKANVIQSDKLPNIPDIDRRKRQFDRKQMVALFKSPLSIRIPLLDPERFLAKTSPFVLPLISKFGALLWMAVVAYGILQMMVHWGDLTDNLSDRVLSLQNILLMALVYPVVKVFHELGHAYCVKKWGGEVHEIGIIILVFFPVPYVDATASSAFSNKYRRMLVGAAGILVEAFLAALAMIVWTYLEPGILRSLVFNTIMISGVSTVLFNGNPLLRFDAYYVLSDYLEIPNLGARSNNYIGYLIKRYLFVVRDAVSSAASLSEAAWLASYSIAAFMYRIFITIVITIFVASEYFIFGAIIGLWFIYMSVVSPMLKMLAKPFTDPMLVKIRSRIMAISGGVLVLLAILLFVIPFPFSTKVEAVLWVGEQAYIRPDIDGYVSGLGIESGNFVRRDDVILELSNNELDAKTEVLKYQVRESEERYQASLSDRSASEIIKEELQYLKQEYLRALERQALLQVRAHQTGKLVIHDQSNLIGRYVRRGQMLGYIADDEDLPVTAMISEDDIDYIENKTNSIEVRFVSRPDKVIEGSIRRISPSASHDLISPVLSLDGGGEIALDPNAGDNRRAFQRYYKVEIEVPGKRHSQVEERVYVLFKHDAEPLSGRLYRAVRRVFLRHFDA